MQNFTPLLQSFLAIPAPLSLSSSSMPLSHLHHHRRLGFPSPTPLDFEAERNPLEAHVFVLHPRKVHHGNVVYPIFQTPFCLLGCSTLSWLSFRLLKCLLCVWEAFSLTHIICLIKCLNQSKTDWDDEALPFI